MKTKFCSRCKQEKQTDEFYKSKKRGLFSHCKKCCSELYADQTRRAFERINHKQIPLERECTVCHSIKPSRNFYLRVRSVDGLNHICKECHGNKSKIYDKNRKIYPRSNEPKECAHCHTLKPASDFWSKPGSRDGLQSQCKKCRHHGYVESPERTLDSSLKRHYGIDLSTYQKMLAEQNNKCAICGNQETSTKRGKLYNLGIDHDHITGKVRELLCSHCNSAIGNLNDDPELCEKAAAYLRKHSH